jgi:hypothetical protein
MTFYFPYMNLSIRTCDKDYIRLDKEDSKDLKKVDSRGYNMGHRKNFYNSFFPYLEDFYLGIKYFIKMI